MKNSTIATLLNIIPGIGYLYVGRKKAFAVLIIAGTILGAIASYSNPLMQQYYSATTYGMWDWIEVFAALPILAAFMYDGYREAVNHNVQLSEKSSKRKA